MVILETLEERIENHIQINELELQGIVYKLDNIHTCIIKDLLLHTTKIEKMEMELEKQKEVRIYIIAIATTLAILIPIAIQIFI